MLPLIKKKPTQIKKVRDTLVYAHQQNFTLTLLALFNYKIIISKSI